MDSRTKDVYKLMRNIDKLTRGQARVELDWDNEKTLRSFMLIIKPNGGYYKGGIFEFEVTFPLDYPSSSPPAVWCHTKVYHPNIDMSEEVFDLDEYNSNVCVNVLDYDIWQSSYGLQVLVMGLIFLFHHPNLDDPLADGFTSLNEEDFALNVKKYMAGEDIDGITYKTKFLVVDGVLVDNKSSLDSPGLDSNPEKSMSTLEFQPPKLEDQEKPSSCDKYFSDNNSNVLSVLGNARHLDISATDSEKKDNVVLGNPNSCDTDLTLNRNVSISKIPSNSSSKQIDDSKCKSESNITDDANDDDMMIELVDVNGVYILKQTAVHVDATGIRKDSDADTGDTDFDTILSQLAREASFTHRSRGAHANRSHLARDEPQQKCAHGILRRVRSCARSLRNTFSRIHRRWRH